MDFSSLTPAASEIVTATTDNPTVKWITDSYNADQARQVTVPATEVKSLCGLLNKGAELAGLGVTVRVFDGKQDHVPSKDLFETLAKAKSTATMVVKFRGKKRISRPRKAAAPVAE